MIEQAAKIALGTVLYIAVLWVAQRNPRAAGMMLTFPTLNGIGLLMAEPAALEQAAHAMLLMPVLNAGLCAGYLAGFERLAGGGTQPATASCRLMAVFAAAWLMLSWAIAGGGWGVPSEHQWAYALVATGSGLVLTATLMPRQAAASAVATPPSLHVLLLGNSRRIALFALSLAAVTIADRLGSTPAVVGVLASLPLVALFGMHAIAGDDARPLGLRRHALAGMASSVWLGPAIAIAFVAAFWRLLIELARNRSGLDYLLAGAVVLMVGWGLCIVAIWACTSLLQRYQAVRGTRSP